MQASYADLEASCFRYIDAATSSSITECQTGYLSQSNRCGRASPDKRQSTSIPPPSLYRSTDSDLHVPTRRFSRVFDLPVGSTSPSKGRRAIDNYRRTSGSRSIRRIFTMSSGPKRRGCDVCRKRHVKVRWCCFPVFIIPQNVLQGNTSLWLLPKL